jgi:hypothetical protein
MSLYLITKRLSPILLGLLANQISWAQSMVANADADSATKIVRFESVQPVLRKHCASCHNDEQPRGDFSVASIDKIMAGSSSGPAVVPGNVEASPLYLLTAHLDGPKMPPNKPRIPQRELQLIQRWIQTGLVEETEKQSNPSKPAENPSVAITKSVAPESNGLVEIRPLAHATPVQSIATHPTEPIVAAAGLHQVVFLDPVEKRIVDRAIPVDGKDVTALVFTPDGGQLLIAAGVPGESGTVLRWDLKNKRFLTSLGDEHDTLQSMACSPDGTKIAVGTTKRTISIYDMTTSEKLYTLRKHTDWVTSLNWSPDGLLLASGDRFGSIHLWEAATGQEFATLRGHVGSITGLGWIPSADQLISTGWDGTVRTWDLHALTSSLHWVAHEQGSLGLRPAEGASSNRWLTYGRDKRVNLWELGKQQPVASIQFEDEAIATESIQGMPASSLVVSDAIGNIYLVSLRDSGMQENARLTLPVQRSKRIFAIKKPKEPPRAMVASFESSSVDPSSSSLEPKGTQAPSNHVVAYETDLADAKRALEGVENSLARAYESVSQLEEAAARLKQLIAIQEARIKQAELAKRRNP